MVPMKTLAPSVTTRDPKGLKFISVIEAAYNKADLSEEEAQHVNDTPGLPELVRSFIDEHRLTDQFKDEERESSYGYLSGYTPKDIIPQTNRLRELFPGIGFANQDLLTQIEKGEVRLPKHAEGWFAIPNWMKNPQIFGATYSEVVLTVLETIKQARGGKFYNYREGQIDEEHLRQSARMQEFWKNLSATQGDPDILIVPAQFGIRHRGRSVRRAREVFLAGEFGLGAFAIGIMILMHPERLQNEDDLRIDCAGDEFDDPGGVASFGRAPCFGFCVGGVRFGASWCVHAYDYYGSASGFVPQMTLAA
ncbi:MAG: hypothetical protein AAB645_02270 [Patescibacteria group bacterium]